MNTQETSNNVLASELKAGQTIDYRGIADEVMDIEEYSNNYLQFTLRLFGEDVIILRQRKDLLLTVIKKPLKWVEGIEITEIPFDTWIAISRANGTCDNVSASRWMQTVKPELLKQLTVADWVRISNVLGFSSNWATNRFRESQGL